MCVVVIYLDDEENRNKKNADWQKHTLPEIVAI